MQRAFPLRLLSWAWLIKSLEIAWRNKQEKRGTAPSVSLKDGPVSVLSLLIYFFFRTTAPTILHAHQFI